MRETREQSQALDDISLLVGGKRLIVGLPNAHGNILMIAGHQGWIVAQDGSFTVQPPEWRLAELH